MIPEQLQKLFERRQVGVKFGLENIQALCSKLGNPQQGLNFIHIAGTNGKGSTAAMCEAVLRELGLNVGLYTSPHLIRYHERFRFNGSEIDDLTLQDLLKQVMDAASEENTFFEISTALAFLWFKQMKADVVVLETGLGGRLDATNVVNPVVSVITKIGFDHMQFLGNTLGDIAREKCGIIKQGAPVVTEEQEVEVWDVIESSAQAKGSSLIKVSRKQLDEFQSPLRGEHQRWNTAVAVAAVREFGRKRGLSNLNDEIIQGGLTKTKWPGRCQSIERSSRPILLIDGAHNVLGVKALADEVRNRWGGKKILLIFGAVGDKNVKEMIDILKPLAKEVFLTRVPSERSASLDELHRLIPEAQSFDSLEEALAKADQQADPIVVTGSLFLVGQALAVVQGNGDAIQPNESFAKTL